MIANSEWRMANRGAADGLAFYSLFAIRYSPETRNASCAR